MLPMHQRPKFEKRDDLSYRMAEKVIEFIERFVVIDGKPAVLMDWQRDLLLEILAENPRTRLRLISRVFVSLSRKGGKTGLMAMLVVAWMCSPLAKRGTRIICGANSKEQAELLFSAVKSIMLNSPAIAEMGLFECQARSIFSEEMNISFTVMGSREASAHGESADLVIVDELAQARAANVFQTMEESASAKENSMVIALSTVSERADNPMTEMINAYVQQEKTGIPTDHVAVFNWTADRDIPWDSDEAIHQANPSARHWPHLYEAISRARDQSRVSDRARSRYMTYRLNIPGMGSDALVDMERWRELTHPEGPEYHRTKLKGEPVFLAVDLSRVDDLSALAAYWPGQKHLHGIGYMLESMIAEHSKSTGQPFDIWARKGDGGSGKSPPPIKAIKGAVIDYDLIAEEIGEFERDYEAMVLRFDAWGMESLRSSLLRADVSIPMEAVRQGFKSFDPLVRRLETLMAKGEFTHSGVPPMNYCFASAITQEAANSISGERRVLKAHPSVKIDIAVAALMAIGDGLKERKMVMTLDDMMFGYGDGGKPEENLQEEAGAD